MDPGTALPQPEETPRHGYEHRVRSWPRFNVDANMRSDKLPTSHTDPVHVTSSLVTPGEDILATFKALDWSDLDAWAILVGRGVATLQNKDQHPANAWFQQHDYEVLQLDFASGISSLVAQLGKVLGWASQFGVGHELHPESRNLDALRDGFRFNVPEQGGLVLTLQAFEQAWNEDRRWCAGFLSIISEFSLQQLALGRRFFAVIEVADQSSVLVGSQFESLSIGYPFEMLKRSGPRRR